MTVSGGRQVGMAVVGLKGFLAALGLALAALPAAAQEPVPVQSGDTDYSSTERANPDKPAVTRAREEASAAAAEVACTAGDQAGCTRLARAYRFGEGKPQNRPVAELLLREACAANNADGCFELGALIYYAEGNREKADAGGKYYAKACDLGSLDGCEALAFHWEGVSSAAAPEVDWAAQADILRRQTCEKGGVAACRSLADAAIHSDNTPAEQEQGKAALEQLCTRGDGRSCSILTRQFLERDEYGNLRPSPDVRVWLDLGCRAGEDQSCYELGLVTYAESSGPPEQRSAALALLDQACHLYGFSTYCEPGKAIRSIAPLTESCARGVQADCIALGYLYADAQSLIHWPDRAIQLLGNACDAGAIETCDWAAGLQSRIRENAPDSERWLQIACDGGRTSECGSLGLLLIGSNPTPEERARALDLISIGCEGGDRGHCQKLTQYAESSPDVPYPSVDDQYLPPMSPEERTAVEIQRYAEMAADQTASCTTTQVEFRGQTYTDTTCDVVPYVLGGYRLRPGDAPWQALLWRPEVLNGQTLNARQRVECGGALIRHGWVLTAAHCIVDAKKKPLLTPEHRIRLGLTTPGAAEGISYPILRAIPHPTYHEASRAFDIALIQIDPARGVKEKTVQEIATIRLDPQPLDARPVKSGMTVYSFGWGRTSVRGQASDYLKGVKLNLEDPDACAKRNRFTAPLLQGGLLCASAPDRSQVCNGDSGGPLITYGDVDRIPTVIGVVSAGEECGTTGVPSRYTRVAKVRDWLDKTMGPRPGTTTRAPRGR